MKVDSESAAGLLQGAYDVVVLGSGGAGLRAAIAACEYGARVLVVSKGFLQPSGATGSANFSFCAALGQFGAADTPERFAADILEGGHRRGLPKLAERLAREAGPEAERLAAWGITWTCDHDGGYDLASFSGHRFPRALHVNLRTGKVLMSVLLRRARALGVALKRFAFAVDLLTCEGRVVGVVVLEVPSGELACVAAPAVVIATGGAMEMFDLQTNPSELTGDGVAIAYRAGAALVDAEFFQFYPTVFASPPGARGVHLPSGRLLDMGARLINAHGESFFERHAEGPAHRGTRDELARVMALEVQAGGGTRRGAVFLDATGLPERTVRAKFADSYFRDLGIDVVREPQEVAPAPHYMMGGIAIDASGRTTLEGLFAAGEVAGGVHGANRLTGNALPEIVVFGAAAGAAAARHAAFSPPPTLDPDQARAIRDRAHDFRRAVDGGGSARAAPSGLRRELQALMGRAAGVLKNADTLEAGLKEIARLEDGGMGEARLLSSVRPWNWEWMEALELANMLVVARLHLRAALIREESVGSHNRLDFPRPNPKRLCRRILLRQGPEGPVVDLEPLPTP